MTMNIKNLKITKFNNSKGLIGFASFNLEGIEINSIRIYKTDNGGISISFPYTTSKSEVKYYIVKPENESIEELLTEIINEKIESDESENKSLCKSSN